MSKEPAMSTELNSVSDENDDFSEELLSDLKDFADAIDHTPTQMEMEDYGPRTVSVYVEQFETWEQALQSADLEKDRINSKFTVQDLIDEIRRVADICGHIPTIEEFDDKSEISSSTYYNHFGSWQSAIDESDLMDEYEPPCLFDIQSEDLLDEIRRLTSVLGRAPTIAEMNELGEYSERTYQRRFGSWLQSLETAGVADDKQEPEKTQISKEELLSSLQAVARKLDRSPSFEDMREHGKYGPTTYSYRFGSWNEALKAAELQPRRSSNTQIPEHELITELRRLAKELGHVPQRKEMDDGGNHSGMTYYNRFGSWQNSIKEAGISEMDL